MPYQVEFTTEAANDLARLDRVIAQRILRKIKWLSENFDTLTPEVLSGEWKGLFKLRVGSYRVAYTTDRKERTITIHLIGHRRDIYKVNPPRAVAHQRIMKIDAVRGEPSA